MTATLLDTPPVPVSTLLRGSPSNDLQRLRVEEDDVEVTISGIVPTYYLKQMAQETVRPALAGRRLRNRIIVLPPK